jgi:uroporphyrinogen-III synthase
VSKVRDLEAQLQQMERQLRLFQQISRFMVREMPLREILDGINQLIVGFLNCDSCLIYLADAGELVLCSSNRNTSTLGKIRLKMAEGLTGWVAREQRLLSISREAYRDRRFKKFANLPEDSFEAFLSAPIIARGRVLGVVNVQHRAAHQHSGEEMELIATVAEQIGTILIIAASTPQSLDQVKHVDILFPAVMA